MGIGMLPVLSINYTADLSSGMTDDFCQAGCLSDYGECKGISVIDSWRCASTGGKTDKQARGQYYWDKEANIFWT
jgi:chitinase